MLKPQVLPRVASEEYLEEVPQHLEVAQEILFDFPTCGNFKHLATLYLVRFTILYTLYFLLGIV